MICIKDLIYIYIKYIYKIRYSYKIRRICHVTHTRPNTMSRRLHTRQIGTDHYIINRFVGWAMLGFISLPPPKPIDVMIRYNTQVPPYNHITIIPRRWSTLRCFNMMVILAAGTGQYHL